MKLFEIESDMQFNFMLRGMTDFKTDQSEF